MKRGFLFIMLMALTLVVAAQETGNFGTDAPPPTSYVVFGPRVGVCGIFQDPLEFSTTMASYFGEGTYHPVLSIFGFNF